MCRIVFWWKIMLYYLFNLGLGFHYGCVPPISRIGVYGSFFFFGFFFSQLWNSWFLLHIVVGHLQIYPFELSSKKDVSMPMFKNSYWSLDYHTSCYEYLDRKSLNIFLSWSAINYYGGIRFAFVVDSLQCSSFYSFLFYVIGWLISKCETLNGLAYNLFIASNNLA